MTATKSLSSRQAKFIFDPNIDNIWKINALFLHYWNELQSNQVKRTPLQYINEMIIWKLNR